MKVLTGNTIFTSPSGEGTAILRGHPSHAKVQPLAVQREYSRLSLNGHLYKTDTSVKRTPRVGPCLSLLLLFDFLEDGHLSKTDS